MSAKRVHRAVALPAGLALVLVPAALASSKPPARDTFRGALKGTSGRVRGASAREVLIIKTGEQQGSTRTLTVTLRRTTCPAHGRCIKASGVLHGTITQGPRQNPDAGQSFTLRAAGSPTGLGKTNLGGTVEGTGFVLHGHESMRVTLRTPRGTITFVAQSDQVPGFTSP